MLVLVRQLLNQPIASQNLFFWFNGWLIYTFFLLRERERGDTLIQVTNGYMNHHEPVDMTIGIFD